MVKINADIDKTVQLYFHFMIDVSCLEIAEKIDSEQNMTIKEMKKKMYHEKTYRM